MKSVDMVGKNKQTHFSHTYKIAKGAYSRVDYWSVFAREAGIEVSKGAKERYFYSFETGETTKMK